MEGLSATDLAAADQARSRALDQYDWLVDTAMDLLGQGIDPTRICLALCALVACDLGDGEGDPDDTPAAIAVGVAGTAIAIAVCGAVREAQWARGDTDVQSGPDGQPGWSS